MGARRKTSAESRCGSSEGDEWAMTSKDVRRFWVAFSAVVDCLHFGDSGVP